MQQYLSRKSGFLFFAVLLIAALFWLAAPPAWADQTEETPAASIQVTVGVYDYTARSAGLTPVSTNGTVMAPRQVQVPAGSMAIDAIEAALTAGQVPFVAPEEDYGRYIQSVNGLAELAGGQESGWLFCLNGDFANSGAAATEIQDGDVLELHYSMEGYGTDVGNYWSALPIFTYFQLAGTQLILSCETTYDADWNAATTYYVGEGDQRQILPGKGTEEEPFLLTILAEANTDLSQLTAEYETSLHPHYQKLDPDPDQPRDYTNPVQLTLSTRSGSFTTYYQVRVGVDYGVTYWDVPASHWAYEPIYFLTGRQIFQGAAGGAFFPDANIKRCDFVTLLARMSGENLESYTANFVDVAADSYYAQAVAWAVANGISTGRTPDRFQPDQPITRQEIAAMLYRYAKAQGQAVEKMDVERLFKYEDGSATADYALEAMEWCLDAGLLNGYPDGTLQPQSYATRAAVAKILAQLAPILEQEEAAQ